MKKAFQGMIIILFAFCALARMAAQGGYKNYKWGMTVAQVKAISPNIKFNDDTYWPAPMHALLYSYRKEISPNEFLDPTGYESKEIAIYDVINTDNPWKSSYTKRFYFVGNSLVGVEIEFCDDSVLSDLTKQYGNAWPIHCVNSATSIYDTASWHDSNDRYIVWERRYVEDVTYIDGKWLSSLLDRTISDYRKERADTKSLLD